MSIPCVSVVIPVYNVEMYLERCVESVLNQTLKDLEVILVDDGSPDHCPKMCDDYVKKDFRIKVIHKKNGGLASARNAGMRVATGKYLFFLDSDDWLEKGGLKTLYDVAEQYKVDFVRYRAIRTGWPGLEYNAPCMVEDVREMRGGYYDKQRMKEEVYSRLLATSQLTMGAVVGAWGSLYSRHFLSEHDLYFYEEVKFSEDLVFSARVVRAASCFYYIDEPGIYHYFYNKDSISKSFREGRWDSCKSLITFCEKDFAVAKEYDFSKQLYYLRWFCILLALNERYNIDNKEKRIQYCKKLLKDPVIKKTRLKLTEFDVTWKQKVLMILVKARMSRLIAMIH